MSMPEMWLSKYALADGLKLVAMRKVDDKYAFPAEGPFVWTCFRVGAEAHHSKANAIAAAEAMRVKKIASLEKQLAKLKAMKFE